MWFRSFAVALLSLFLALSVGRGTAQSAHRTVERSISRQSAHGSVERTTDWQRYDTATYVVSTLNLLHTRTGFPVVPEWLKRGARSFDVYADTAQPDLYFIELKDDSGRTLGALAYELGWPMPKSLTSPLLRIHLPPAPKELADAYQNDPKELIGSFFTLPGLG